MKFDYGILEAEEKLVFALRALYYENGYRQYKMSKFEDYDLYSRNKDFLISDRLITFTDTNGRLKALKPDVTLSIIKSYKDAPGKVEKLCYNESIYRVSKGTGAFRELTQTGLECIGAVDETEISRVLTLAAASLAQVRDRYVLEISNLDILSAFVSDLTEDRGLQQEVIRLVGEKNLHGLEELADREGLDRDRLLRLKKLVSSYGEPQKVLKDLRTLTAGTVLAREAEDFAGKLQGLMEEIAPEHLLIDFSLVSNLKYYNGIIFQGYIEGAAGCVLSGGQYDKLMRRMDKKARAIGFAVYLDALERIGE